MTTQTMYVGEDLLLKVNAANPVTGEIGASPTETVTVSCYAQGKDPAGSAVDRANPDYTFTLPYVPGMLAYYDVIPTAGWAAGTWTLRIDLTGALTAHSYRTVKLVDG